MNMFENSIRSPHVERNRYRRVYTQLEIAARNYRNCKFYRDDLLKAISRAKKTGLSERHIILIIRKEMQ